MPQGKSGEWIQIQLETASSQDHNRSERFKGLDGSGKPVHDMRKSSVDTMSCVGVAAVPDPITSPEPRYIYDWQRPTDTYKESLLARQAVLRDSDLEADDELLAEWFALLAEMDRLVREEHSLEDNLQIRSCQYYKEVLLARQAELRQVDLQSSPALLIEWYTLIKELDYVVRRQAYYEQKSGTKIQPVGELIRQSKVKAAGQFNAPGGCRYAAASRSRPSTSQGATLQSGGKTASPQHKSLSYSDTDTQAFQKNPGSLSADDSGSATLDPLKTGAIAITMDNFTLLTPAEQLRALVRSPVETDMEDTSRWIDTLENSTSGWTPPTLEEIQKSKLPSWLVGDEAFMEELTNDISFELDAQQMSAAELKRQIAEKDEELRLAHMFLEVQAAKKKLAQDRSTLDQIPDVGQRADMSIELVDRQLELECKEKEMQADEMLQDIRDLDEELAKARLVMLTHPLIGEMVDRAAIMDELAQAYPGVNVRKAQADVAARTAGPLMLTNDQVQLGAVAPETVRDVQNQLVCDAATACHVNSELSALRQSAMARAKRELSDAPNIRMIGTNPKDWQKQELDKIREGSEARQGLRENVSDAVQIAKETESERVHFYNKAAQKEIARQVRLADRRAASLHEQLRDGEQRRVARTAHSGCESGGVKSRAHDLRAEKDSLDSTLSDLQRCIDHRKASILAMNEATRKTIGTPLVTCCTHRERRSSAEAIEQAVENDEAWL